MSSLVEQVAALFCGSLNGRMSASIKKGIGRTIQNRHYFGGVKNQVSAFGCQEVGNKGSCVHDVGLYAIHSFVVSFRKLFQEPVNP